MSSFNKITIVGNLGRDPELRYTPQGTPVLGFSVATNERRGKGEQKVETTTWFRVTVFGKQAETMAQFLAKGRKVFLTGRLSMETYQKRDGGGEGVSLEVTADDIQLLDAKPEGDGTRAAAAGAGAQGAGAAVVGNTAPIAEAPVGDDIPF